MNTKKAYRLEHKTIQSDCKKVFAGPYSFSTNLEIEVEDWADEDTEGHTDQKHPEPLLDKKLAPQLNNLPTRKYWAKTVFFGFKSIPQLKKWFSNKELQRLKDQGFCIAVYEVKERLDSPFQAAFIPNKKPRKVIEI